MSDCPIGRCPPGYAYLNYLFRFYKSNAKRARRTFRLGILQFHEMISKRCHYCGANPVEGKSSVRFHGTIKHHGLDRVDNLKGYSLDNVVPCCRQRNYAKGNMGRSEFLEWAEKFTATKL